MTNTLPRKHIIFMAISCTDIFIRTIENSKTETATTNVKPQIMSNHQCNLLYSYFKFDGPYSKKKFKIELEIEFKTSSHYIPPHHLSSRHSILIIRGYEGIEMLTRRRYQSMPFNDFPLFFQFSCHTSIFSFTHSLPLSWKGALTLSFLFQFLNINFSQLMPREIQNSHKIYIYTEMFNVFTSPNVASVHLGEKHS